MQFVNDDMDDLFRRASEEYSLNTNSSDWNKVLQGLHHTEGMEPEDGKKKKDYKFLWLLLLLPIGFICGRYFDKNRNTSLTVEKTLEKQPELNATSQGRSGTNDNLKRTQQNIKKSTTARNKTTTNTNNSSNGPAEPLIKTREAHKNIKRDEEKVFVNAKRERQSVKASSLRRPANFDLDKYAKKKADNIANKTYENSNMPLNGVNKTIGGSTSSSLDSTRLAAGNNKISDTANHTVSRDRQITKKERKPFKQRFYYSLVIGPDNSTVKFQRLTDIGYTAGLMLGFQLSRKFSVEAGALYDKKNYRTNGEYLNADRLKLPVHSIILNAAGYCNMIELPVNLKYDVISKTNYSLFISAGISSYLMKKEDYDLSYKRYEVRYDKNYYYHNSSKDWFSILNISAGYQTSINKNLNFKVAPYLKLPLRGVGVGKLPITSTGVYFTLSRFIR